MTVSTRSVEASSVGKAAGGFSILIVRMIAVYRAKGRKVNAGVGLYWNLFLHKPGLLKTEDMEE
jgi:hypothetical protein